MAQTDTCMLASGRDRSAAERFKTLRQVILLLALAAVIWSAEAAATCPKSLAPAEIIDHDFKVSFCELCDIGTVTLIIENPYQKNDDVDLSDLVITEDLQNSGFAYVPNSTRFSTKNVATP